MHIPHELRLFKQTPIIKNFYFVSQEYTTWEKTVSQCVDPHTVEETLPIQHHTYIGLGYGVHPMWVQRRVIYPCDK